MQDEVLYETTVARSDGRYDGLLSLPSPDELDMVESQEEYTPPLHRKKSPFKNTSERFVITSNNYADQYAPLYSARFRALKPILLERVKKEWNEDGEYEVLDKLLDINNGERPCIIVGTLFKDMPLVSRLLAEFNEESIRVEVAALPNYVSKDDTLILEDESGRTTLVGSLIGLNSVITGLVVAVKGRSTKGGEFEVQQICFPGLPPQPSITRKPSSEPHYVALVSGLNIGMTNEDPLALQMLVDYLTGNLGSESEQNFVANIVRLIVVGNSLTKIEDSENGSTLRHQGKTLSRTELQRINGPLQDLDMLLAELAASLPTDLLPGENDPSNYTIPQQPINRRMLPLSSQFNTFNAVTNPYECDLDNRLFLGTSGQVIDNIAKYMVSESRIELMEKTLQWRHIAPTAPDQMHSCPFHEKDPFIINTTPHVYYMGNQEKFETKLVQGPEGQQVRLIALPSFATTQTVVLLNLDTLAVHPVRLRTAL